MSPADLKKMIHDPNESLIVPQKNANINCPYGNHVTRAGRLITSGNVLRKSLKSAGRVSASLVLSF